jgi:TonB family protein
MHVVGRLIYQAFIGPRRAKFFSVIVVCAGAIAVGAAAFAGSVDSAEVDSSEAITFDIPAESLEAALDAYGRASRMHVLYESALTAGLRSVSVKGSFTADQALRRLLGGTNLAVRYTGPKSYTLVPVSEEDTGAAVASAKVVSLAPPRLHVLDFRHFLGGVQAGITERLCSDLLTRPGSYRITLQFWVNSAGTVQSPTLLRSSGDNARDAAITEVLRNLRFSEAAPADMPQPITMVVAPRTAGADGDCAKEPPRETP